MAETLEQDLLLLIIVQTNLRPTLTLLTAETVELKERRRLHYVSYSKQFIMTAQFKHYQLPDGLSEVR